MAELAEHCKIIGKTQARHDGARPSPEHAKRHSSPILLIRQLVQHVSQGVTLEINLCLGKSSVLGLLLTELSDIKIIPESSLPPPERLADPFLEKHCPVLVRDQNARTHRQGIAEELALALAFAVIVCLRDVNIAVGTYDASFASKSE